jgi:hypothetical protein
LNAFKNERVMKKVTKTDRRELMSTKNGQNANKLIAWNFALKVVPQRNVQTANFLGDILSKAERSCAQE